MTKSKYGYIAEDKIYRSSFREFPARPIGEVKTDEASSVIYFEERFQVAEQKVEALEEAVASAENKGSYLMKLIHLKDYLVNLDAIGDFEALFVRLEKLEEVLNKMIAENRANNLLIKRELIREAQVLKGSTNWKEDTDKFKALKNRWITTGNVEKEFEAELGAEFSEIVDDFFKRRQAYFQTKHQIVQNKIRYLKGLLEKAKAIIKDPSKDARGELIALQQEWKKMGKIPGNQSRALFQEFRNINDGFFRRRTGSNGIDPSLSSEETIKEKQRMVDVVKGMAGAPEILKSDVDKVKKLQQDWKSLGPLPKDKNKFLSEAFYTACSLVLERHFIENLAIHKHKNYEGLSETERLEVKLQLTKELLTRDQNELLTFQENLEKVNPNTNSVNKLIKSKFSQQERKVRVKKKLLEAIENELRKK